MLIYPGHGQIEEKTYEREITKVRTSGDLGLFTKWARPRKEEAGALGRGDGPAGRVRPTRPTQEEAQGGEDAVLPTRDELTARDGGTVLRRARGGTAAREEQGETGTPRAGLLRSGRGREREGR